MKSFKARIVLVAAAAGTLLCLPGQPWNSTVPLAAERPATLNERDAAPPWNSDGTRAEASLINGSWASVFSAAWR